MVGSTVIDGMPDTKDADGVDGTDIGNTEAYQDAEDNNIFCSREGKAAIKLYAQTCKSPRP